MNALISVIVTVFNVEHWLSGCLDSITNQPFKDIEIILVNDGSKDKSGEICNDIANRDSRIKVVHKENGGQSSARNTGIGLATGEYIVFIDSDDKIHEDYFCKLYQAAKENDCDAVVCGYRTVPNNINISPGFKTNSVIDGKNFILSSRNVHSNNDLCFVWRYIYKLSLIKEKNLKFNEGISWGEDVIFNLEFLLRAEKVYALPEILYFYTINNPTSLMRIQYKPNLDRSLARQYKIRKKLSQKYGLMNEKKYKKDLANYFVRNIYRLILNNLRNSPEHDLYSSIKQILRYEMFTESIKEIGLNYQCETVKEYLYYLAMKFKMHPIICELYKRENK